MKFLALSGIQIEMKTLKKFYNQKITKKKSFIEIKEFEGKNKLSKTFDKNIFKNFESDKILLRYLAKG